MSHSKPIFWRKSNLNQETTFSGFKLPCIDFQNGSCPFGVNCRFTHVDFTKISIMYIRLLLKNPNYKKSTCNTKHCVGENCTRVHPEDYTNIIGLIDEQVWVHKLNMDFYKFEECPFDAEGVCSKGKYCPGRHKHQSDKDVEDLTSFITKLLAESSKREEQKEAAVKADLRLDSEKIITSLNKTSTFSEVLKKTVNVTDTETKSDQTGVLVTKPSSWCANIFKAINSELEAVEVEVAEEFTENDILLRDIELLKKEKQELTTKSLREQKSLLEKEINMLKMAVGVSPTFSFTSQKSWADMCDEDDDTLDDVPLLD